MTNRAPERLLTIAQAAEMCSYGEDVILQWIARGLPHVAPCGRVRPRHADIRIRQSELWAWIDSLTLERKPAPAEAPKPARKVKIAPPGAAGLSAWRDMKPGTKGG